MRNLPNLGDAREYLSLAPGFEHAAILRCCKAWNEKYIADKVAGKEIVTCLLNANDAYRDAMPPLYGTQGTADFTACVAHAMVSGVMSDLQGKVLLDAVKIATQLLPKLPKTKQIPSKPAAKSKNSSTVPHDGTE